jgi:hypothetical protein
MQQPKQHRYSKVFRHTCKICAIYFILWAIAIAALLLGALFDFFLAIASVVFSLTPHLLKLGCILTLAVIVAVTLEGFRDEDIKPDD